ncbi:hypothetical protein IYZ83_004210 [Wolbachia pipientis]|uniref:hypothetical protein n=1 Tax=Wolbachia pipientis TaxID=955 RepID=UPI001F1A8C71|nr:hypothetical protein [Wolbachia pipientis]UIP91353.1 hypothetical protein IYZ83_004210 [Wolbachia pipientis]
MGLNYHNLKKHRRNFLDITGLLFYRASIRAKVKIRPGRLYSRNKVDKPKRHHVFRRVC